MHLGRNITYECMNARQSVSDTLSFKYLPAEKS